MEMDTFRGKMMEFASCITWKSEGIFENVMEFAIFIIIWTTKRIHFHLISIIST